MENDISSQTEGKLQRVFCGKLSEPDRSLLHDWLTSKLNVERCGWKKKLQDALKMVDDERRSSVDANSFIARLYADMVKILPPILRIKGEGTTLLEPSEEFVDMRSYRLKEVQCMWKTISRMFQSNINIDQVGAERNLNDALENDRPKLSPAIEGKAHRDPSLTFPRGAVELNFRHFDIKRTTSLVIDQTTKCSDETNQRNRSLFMKSFSIMSSDIDQNSDGTKTHPDGLNMTSIAPPTKADVECAFTATGGRKLFGHEVSEICPNLESNSGADSDKGQLSDRSHSGKIRQIPELQTKECLNNSKETENTTSIDNVGKHIANPYNTDHTIPTQKKSPFKSESSNNNSMENQNTLRKKRNRFRKCVKNI